MEAAQPIRRYEHSEPAAVAEALFRRGWLPADARAAIVFAHGFGEHSGRYEHVGRWFAERGLALHAYDHVGHGQSSGLRCYVDRFDDYLDDFHHVVQRVRSEQPGVPLFLAGHSMGGLVVAAYTRERKPEAAGVLLSGPALGLAEGTSRTKLALARWVRRVLPRLAMPAGLDLDGLSTDPRVREAYLADPLVELKITTALAAELTATTAKTGPGGADVQAPLLILHGEDDPLCRAQASQTFAEAAPQGRCIRYPGLRHEIFNEPSHEKVFADALAFFETRLAAGDRGAR